jgi:hypothetical protein
METESKAKLEAAAAATAASDAAAVQAHSEVKAAFAKAVLAEAKCDAALARAATATDKRGSEESEDEPVSAPPAPKTLGGARTTRQMKKPVKGLSGRTERKMSIVAEEPGVGSEDSEDSEESESEDEDGAIGDDVLSKLSKDQLDGLSNADHQAITQMAALGAFDRNSFAFRAGSSHTPPVCLPAESANTSTFLPSARDYCG